MAGILLLLLVPLLVFLYIRTNDRKLSSLPAEVIATSPKRWTKEEVKQTEAALVGAPPSLLSGQLPPKTGRRYIVVGGAGFLGGWIVVHLLARGEDPRRIRVLDIRAPVRKDLTEGAAKDVDFLRVDMSDAQAVDAAFTKPWPTDSRASGEPEPELTVFHTAAIIRFYERHPDLLRFSDNINVKGTQNILDAARRVGASTLVYTSSGSISVRRTRFWLWPWEMQPGYFVQAINDDDSLIPKQHDHFFSNYAVSKSRGEQLVRAAEKSPSGSGVLRTGCIRPGNGIYGPGGDILIGLYLAQKKNMTWIANIMSSFVFVENCSLSHLCYEQRLIELQRGSAHPDIGGQAFCVADAGPTTTYGEIYDALTLLTKGEVSFYHLSPTTMLALAHVVEAYYVGRHFLMQSPFAFLGRVIPPLTGDIVLLQPTLFALTNIHLLFDDSRARAPPEKGGLGYNGGITTLQGVCKVYLEHLNGGVLQRSINAHSDVDHEFNPARAEKGVEEIVKKVEKSVEKGEKLLSNGIHRAANALNSK
ncbi:NAD(P)-binding protein [Sparassis latifolia]